jgi:hypothetical protein
MSERTSEPEPDPQPRRRQRRVRSTHSGGTYLWPRINYNKMPGTFSMPLDRRAKRSDHGEGDRA